MVIIQLVRITTLQINYFPSLKDPFSLMENQKTKIINRLILQIIRNDIIPGVSFAYFYQNRSYQQAYGLRNTNTRQPMTPSTIFNIESISKFISATAMLIGIDNHEFDFSTRLDNHLQLSDPWVANVLEFQDVLSHRSGLPEFASERRMCLNYPQKEIIQSFADYRITDFRNSFKYQNILYNYAQQAVSKKQREYIERLFDYACMSETTMGVESLEREENSAHPSSRNSNNEWIANPFPDELPQEPGASGINSNVIDLINFGKYHLNRGVIRSVEKDNSSIYLNSINPTLFDRMYEIRSKSNDIFVGDYYGFGVGINLKPHTKFYNHAGDYELGYDHNIIVDPDNNLIIVVLTNALTGIAWAFSNFIRNILLNISEGEALKIFEREFGAFGRSIKSSIQKCNPSLIIPWHESLIKNMIGTYNNLDLGSIVITSIKDEIFIIIGKTDESLLLNKDHYWETTIYNESFRIDQQVFIVPSGSFDGMIIGLAVNIFNGTYMYEKIHKR